MTESAKPARKPRANKPAGAPQKKMQDTLDTPAVMEGDKHKKAKTAAVTSTSAGNLREMVFFAIRNRKLVIGLSIVLFFALFAVFGPYLAQHQALAYGGPVAHHPTVKSGYYFGTNNVGQDIFAQVATGLRLTFEVGLVGGALAAVIGMVVGFTAGYKAGIVDEVLNMITNVVLCLPVFAVILVIASYMSVKSVLIEALFIGCISWPWAARALRAQTFSLTSREFVSLARLSGERSWKIIFKEIAPNMSSYLFMMFILLFGGAILIAATLDFLGLGPQGTYSLGQILQLAVQNAALTLKMWWWFVPPGLAIMLIVGGAYFMNVGLDEVFNPRLREM
jgi:peptide/nickel transport system permease protein